MKKQIFNPFLPLDKYICDVEPHVFGNRVYAFGSQDREGGKTFCELDYEAYSAPIDDLKSWRSEGVIYRAEQDPHATSERKYLYAPDVVRGNDGRYYLYYALSCSEGKGGFDGPISVAVCDSPAGKYEYYGDVKTPDGEPLRFIPFDPALLNDEGQIWLYYGWALPVKRPKIPFGKTIWRKVMQAMFHQSAERIKNEPLGIMGGNVVELDRDMLTVISEPRRIIPAPDEAVGTSFDGHAFFEASSIRKIGDTYYFIYSSSVNHQLCYATSSYPDRDFQYAGIIISAGDVGYDGRKEKDRVNMTSNNHGSIEYINGKWYIFYHRHTHATTYSRQCCAEEIQLNSAGSISQVEITSSGLNGEPLAAEGEYPAVIACWLTNGKMPHNPRGIIKRKIPHIDHDADNRYITSISNGTLIGFKYFDFSRATAVSVITRGSGKGNFFVLNDSDAVSGSIPIEPSTQWSESKNVLVNFNGKQGLFFCFEGKGKIDMLSLVFHVKDE